ncbi:MAG TPA: hypothetical protein VG711_04830, partial [Phycisphaerales bacterium]|nr:hypothetical protein [Phycisphaerales bacterium]
MLSLFLLFDCSSNQHAAPFQTDPLLGAPADFSLELFVRPGASVPADASHLAPAHFLIDPDGSLHYEAVGSPQSGLPPIIRKLSRRQLADLWASLNQSGFADPSAGTSPVNHDLLAPAPDETIQLVSISADSRN